LIQELLVQMDDKGATNPFYNMRSYLVPEGLAGGAIYLQEKQGGDTEEV
jgi:hypothetical protein